MSLLIVENDIQLRMFEMPFFKVARSVDIVINEGEGPVLIPLGEFFIERHPYLFVNPVRA